MQHRENISWQLRLGLLLIGLLVHVPGWQCALEGAEAEFFDDRVRPILAEYCYRCHSEDLDEPAGGLVLDTAAGIRRGGRSGAAVIPGDPKESLLIAAIRYRGLEMPPDDKLDSELVRVIELWIERGATDSRLEESRPEAGTPGTSRPGSVKALASPAEKIQLGEKEILVFPLFVQSWPNGIAAWLLCAEPGQNAVSGTVSVRRE